jgi:4'-phosphopantetheinyl transferase
MPQVLATAGAPLALVRDRHGRPQLGAPDQGHDINWSHSGAGLLVAVGAGVRVGVDLEFLRPRPRAMALASRFFTPGEATRLAAMDPPAREEAFVRLWCAKEAVLKAHGRGLSFGLHRLEFELRAGSWVLVACDPALGGVADWSVQAFVPGPGYLASVAWAATAPGHQVPPPTMAP